MIRRLEDFAPERPRLTTIAGIRTHRPQSNE